MAEKPPVWGYSTGYDVDGEALEQLTSKLQVQRKAVLLRLFAVALRKEEGLAEASAEEEEEEEEDEKEDAEEGSDDGAEDEKEDDADDSSAEEVEEKENRQRKRFAYECVFYELTKKATFQAHFELWNSCKSLRQK
ncbi:unnamed protein product [Dibothriocephalus latus]|uniref:Uncharacterized protein n=1 Tax=Dibothriocephalus latus TaxID=60516 RepID=A0A3P7RGJ6_DIBLA|nr:unnamed protein product [Dibothriocephalus latus]